MVCRLRFVAGLAFLSLAISAAAGTEPLARAGRLDLSSWDFGRQGVVALSGEWEFANNRLVGGAQPWPAGAESARAPGSWNSLRGSAQGAGTYRLQVDCTAAGPLALNVPAQSGALRIFVNGRQVAQHGTPGLTPLAHERRFERQLVPLDGARCPLDIRVEISNFEHLESGLVRPMHLGLRETILELREAQIVTRAVVVASSVVLGIFALFMYARRRRETTVLVFGVYCLSLALAAAFSGDRFLEPWLPPGGYDFQVRLLITAFLVFAALTPLLARSLYPRQAWRAPAVVLSATGAGGAVLAQLAPKAVVAYLVPLISVLSPAVYLYCIAALARACFHRQRGARFVLAAGLLLGGAMLAELFGLAHEAAGRVVSAGMLVFVLATAALLVQRFLRAMDAEELRAIEQGERADLLVRTTRAGVLDWDLPSGRVRASGRFCEMLGLPAEHETLDVAAVLPLVHPDDREQARPSVCARREGAEARGVHRRAPAEFRMVRPDGEVVWVHAEALDIHGEDGRALRHIVTFIDITHLKLTQEQLRETRSRLVSQARRAGMAQIATNVLHNVGNVLTSVNVSAHLLGDRLRQSAGRRLADTAPLLEEGAGDPGRFFAPGAKGPQLAAYLRDVSRALAAERQELLDEIGRLTQSVDHIKHVVAMQQSYAGAGTGLETASLDGLVDDSLELEEASLDAMRVTVRRDYSPMPPVSVDKVRITQILANLVENACEAMKGVEGERRLDVCVRREGERALVRVRDNGCGIAAENLPRVFSHGFTTKPGGHGFGLHSCAVAAQEMGGTLTAASDGPGTGAAFELSLPAPAPG